MSTRRGALGTTRRTVRQEMGKCGELSFVHTLHLQIPLIIYILVAAVSVAGSYAPNWQLVAVALFLVGFLVVGYWNIYFVGFQEITPTKWRVLPLIISKEITHEDTVTVSTLGGWNVCYFYFCFLQWYFRDWRDIWFYMGIFNVILVPFYLL